MKKIFISGVAGFLGSHLADTFLKKGYKVVGCDNLIGGYLDNVAGEVDFHLCDIGNFGKMAELTKDCSIVFHCAALAYEGLSVFSPFQISQNIFSNSVSLITASIKNKVKRFVYCSSMARYGNQEIIPFTEDLIPNPVDPYGISKLSAEKILQNLSSIHNMEFVIAIPHNIIGPRQKYDDPFRNVVAIMINLMLQKRQPIIYGDGEQKRCFSFIQDDIDILEELAFNPKAKNEIINIGPDQEFVSINELAKIIAQKLNFKLDPIYLDKRPQEVKLANCSCQKARNLFNYNPTTSLADGIDTMIDYIEKRGPKKFKYHLDLEIENESTPKSWTERIF